MDTARVDIDGMVGAQSAFQTALDETTSSYAQMDGQIVGLSGSWQGNAASIYHQAMQDWLTDFSRVNAALQRMLSSLSSNTQVYANVHSDTQHKASQVAQTIGSGGGLAGFPI